MTRSLRSDERALGLIAWALISVGGLVGALAATGGILYASDFAVEATVIDKDCGGSTPGGGLFGVAQSGNTITVKTKLFGIEHTLQDVPADQCFLVQRDNFVRYRIQSERTSIWEVEGGQCIWDTFHQSPTGCDRE